MQQNMNHNLIKGLEIIISVHLNKMKVLRFSWIESFRHLIRGVISISFLTSFFMETGQENIDENLKIVLPLIFARQAGFLLFFRVFGYKRLPLVLIEGFLAFNLYLMANLNYPFISKIVGTEQIFYLLMRVLCFQLLFEGTIWQYLQRIYLIREKNNIYLKQTVQYLFSINKIAVILGALLWGLYMESGKEINLTSAHMELHRQNQLLYFSGAIYALLALTHLVNPSNQYENNWKTWKNIGQVLTFKDFRQMNKNQWKLCFFHFWNHIFDIFFRPLVISFYLWQQYQLSYLALAAVICLLKFAQILKTFEIFRKNCSERYAGFASYLLLMMAYFFNNFYFRIFVAIFYHFDKPKQIYGNVIITRSMVPDLCKISGQVLGITIIFTLKLPTDQFILVSGIALFTLWLLKQYQTSQQVGEGYSTVKVSELVQIKAQESQQSF